MLLVKSADREADAAAVGDAVTHVAAAREHGGVTFAVDVEPAVTPG